MLTSIQTLSDGGGYAIGGLITSGSDTDLILITIDSDLNYCGSLIQTPSDFEIADVTHLPSLGYVNEAFQEANPSTVTYSQLNPKF